MSGEAREFVGAGCEPACTARPREASARHWVERTTPVREKLAKESSAAHTPAHNARTTMKLTTLFVALTALTIAAHLNAADAEAGFKTIFDGKTFDGWKIGDEAAKSWRIEDGALVAQGTRSHIFYVGDEQPFKNFEFKVDVMTKRGSNGGIYFHTKYQE